MAKKQEEQQNPNLPAIPPELKEKLGKIKKKLESFSKKIVDKFDKYICGVALLPPPQSKPGMSPEEIAEIESVKDKIHALVLVDDSEPSKMSKEEMNERLNTIIKKTAEEIDKDLGKIVEYTLAHDGMVLVTADHGNGEEVKNLQTGAIDKEHSTNPVPFLIIGNEYKGQAGPAGDPPDRDLSLLHPVGVLADVAPTVLKLLNIEQPKEMTGRALI